MDHVAKSIKHLALHIGSNITEEKMIHDTKQSEVSNLGPSSVYEGVESTQWVPNYETGEVEEKAMSLQSQPWLFDSALHE